MKNARERMDIISAYREVGSYRGAAALCGTTHKTVRRVIAAHEAGEGRPARAVRARNYDQVAVLVAERVKAMFDFGRPYLGFGLYLLKTE